MQFTKNGLGDVKEHSPSQGENHPITSAAGIRGAKSNIHHHHRAAIPGSMLIAPSSLKQITFGENTLK